MFDLYLDPSSNPSTLNAEKCLLVAMSNLPDSNLIKIVYSLVFGTSGIAKISLTGAKFLVLSGVGRENIGAPQVLTLPAKVCTRTNQVK